VRGGGANGTSAWAQFQPFRRNHPGLSTETQAARGYAEPRGQSGVRSGAFSGYDHGGQARSFSSRGSASFGGGGWREDFTEVVAAEDLAGRWRASVIEVSLFLSEVDRVKFRNGEKPYAANEAELRQISLGQSS
jgi:hypothetical protein